MVFRYLICASLFAAASAAQAGPMNFGGSGSAAKGMFAIGTMTKVGEFGRSEAAPAPAPEPAQASTPRPAAAPAPFQPGSGFIVGPASPANLGNGGQTGGPSTPPPFANAGPAPAPAPEAGPTGPAAPATGPADIGNSEEIVDVLLPPGGVPDAGQLPVAAAPAVDALAIPEPSTGFLMLAGLLGAGALQRRRRNK